MIERVHVRKYFIYAIGEIALVVIGILIALQINNWNQNRLDKERSKGYHQRLIEDLDFIIEGNNNIHKNALSVMNSISQTVAFLEEGKNKSPEEMDIINSAMVRSKRLSRQIPEISTWEEMKSNGDLNLIYNVELRKKLNAFEGYIDLAHEVYSKHAMAIRNDADIYAKYTKTVVESESLTEKVISNFEAMANDPQFINHFSTNLSSWRSQASFSKDISERASILKTEVENELKSMINR